MGKGKRDRKTNEKWGRGRGKWKGREEERRKRDIPPPSLG